MGFMIEERTVFNGKTGAQLSSGENRAGAAVSGSGSGASAAYFHVRYTLRTDTRGASRLAVSGLRLLTAGSRRLRLDVTEGASERVYGGSGGVPLASDGGGVIEVKLRPGRVYYAWLFCDGWCDLFSVQDAVLLPGGYYGTPGVPASQGGFFGQRVSIALWDGSAGARYTVSVRCAGRTELLQERDSRSDLSWTPALETYAALLPDAASALATVRCETFYEGVSAGVREASFPLRFAPGSLAPELSPGWVTVGYDNAGGPAAGIAAWVQGCSRALVSFDLTKVGFRYGASAAGCAIRCGGVTVEAAPYRSEVLGGTAATLVCSVTDSRGQTAEESVPLTLLPYAPPQLSDVEIFHCDANGEPDADGSWLAVKATAGVSPLGGLNAGTLTLHTRAPAGSWTSRGSLVSGVRTVLAGCSPDRSWDVKLTLTDALGRSAVYEQRLPTRAWAMKLRADGNGVGFGKAPEYGGAIEVPDSWTLRFGEKQLALPMLGAAEPGANAAASHAAGEFFLWQDKFVESMGAIAAGEAIAGRVSVTSAAAALTALSASLASHALTLASHDAAIAAHTAALGRLSVQTVTLDEQTVGQGAYALFTLPAARSGHTPVGVVGYAIDNATTNGGKCSFVCPYRAALSGTDVLVYVRNYHASSSAKIKISADVLYL